MMSLELTIVIDLNELDILLISEIMNQVFRNMSAKNQKEDKDETNSNSVENVINKAIQFLNNNKIADYFSILEEYVPKENKLTYQFNNLKDEFINGSKDTYLYDRLKLIADGIKDFYKAKQN